MGLADEFLHPDLIVELALDTDAFFPQTCTIYDVTKSEDPNTGQETLQWTNILAGHDDIPCRKAPLILERPNANEFRTGSEQARQMNEVHISLAGYYPNITADMQAEVDGRRYNISGVEGDGNHISTRLRAFIMVPFNA